MLHNTPGLISTHVGAAQHDNKPHLVPGPVLPLAVSHLLVVVVVWAESWWLCHWCSALVLHSALRTGLRRLRTESHSPSRPGRATPGTPTPNTRSPAQWHDGASGTHARLPLIRRRKRIQRFSRCSTRLNVYCVYKRVLIRVWVPAGGGGLACRAGSAAYSARAVLHLQISVAKYGPGHTWTHMDTPRGQAGVLMSPLVTMYLAASE